jgi:TPR repeat protein
VEAKNNAAEVAEELISRAQGFISDGNMVRAREILSDGALANNPKAAFALAETFDPNILAATGAQGTRAEVERARMLYSKALAGGITAAKRRLDALN